MYAIPFNTFYSFGDNEKIGQHPVSIANEELTWETTTEVNVGLELGFWQDRLTLNADVYNKITDNLLLETPVVNITGYEKAWQNIGKMRNRGVKLSLNALIFDKKNFKWSVNELKAEFYIPYAIDCIIKEGTGRCELLSPPSRWFGVTFKEDRPEVVTKLQELADKGVYPSPLY